MSRSDDGLEDLPDGRFIVSIKPNLCIAKALHKTQDLMRHVVELVLGLNGDHSKETCLAISQDKPRAPLSSGAPSGFGSKPSFFLVTQKSMEITGIGVL